MPSAPATDLPLSALLSQVLVAFTIEFDNEFEHQMPHRTTSGPKARGSSGPWLVSLAMWANCMRFVGDDGVSVGELERLARTTTNLNGMQRWGYITVGPDFVIRATPNGRKAQEVWRPLFQDIEERWEARFGPDKIRRLRELLSALAVRIDIALPDCLPILAYGLSSRRPQDGRAKYRPAAAREDSLDSRLPLSALLSRILLAFAIEFEGESDLSLAISANVLRALDEGGVRVQDLPLLTGVSKEAIHMAMGILLKKLLAVVDPDPKGGRAKVARLNGNGLQAQQAYRRLLDRLEERWQERFGQENIRNLRESLEQLAGNRNVSISPLFRGLEPYPDGWRAAVRKPAMLPHYPMVLHRGGFPDGS